MDINKENLRYITGSQDKVWAIDEMGDGEYLAYDVKSNEHDPNLMDFSESKPHCHGTYFKYNDICPHIQAKEKWELIKRTQILRNTVAVEKMDFSDEIHDVVAINEDGEFLLIRTDGDYGYIGFKIYRDRDYVVIETLNYVECVGLDTLELYGTFSIDSVYQVEDFDKKSLEVYLRYNTNVDESDIDILVSKIFDNLGDKI